MRQWAVAGVSVFLSFIVATAFLGCGGGHGTGPIININLSPSAVSLSPGEKAQLTAQALDSNNNVVASPTLAFHSSSTAITIANDGTICAGQWDANFIVCTPLPPPASGPVAATASVTATATINNANVVSNAMIVTVHEAVDSVQVQPLGGAPDCVSQNGTEQYSLVAFSHDPAACQRLTGSSSTPCSVPTSTLGSIQWQVTPIQVATPDASIHLATAPVLVTAIAPGHGRVAGLLGPSGSAVTGAADFNTCAVAKIDIHQKNTPTPPDTETSFSVAKGTSVFLTADVVDTHGVSLTSTLPLTWTTSQPALATVAGGQVGTLAPGTASITASCTPPACNVNLVSPTGSPLAIYSNEVVTANITGTGASTVLVATTAAPATLTSNAIVPIDTTANTQGTPFILPTNMALNSMVLTPAGNPAFLGTNQGLLRFDATRTTVGGAVGTITGRVLATDGNRVVVSDTANNEVFIATAAATIEATLPIANATSAAIAPDASKIYILAGSTLYAYAPGLPLKPIPLGTGTSTPQGVAFFPTGAMAYAADSGDDVVPSCLDAVQSTVAVGTPSLIAAIPNGTGFVEANSPNIDQIATSTTGTCPPVPTAPSVSSAAFPGVGTFAARQLIVTLDSQLAIILSDKGVLVYHLSNGQPSVISLSGGALPLSGGVTPDGASLYVGASDSNVHRVDLKAGTDAQVIPVSVLCPSTTQNCVPDLVVVKPTQTIVNVTAITVSPTNPTISVGQTQAFTATGTFSDGTSRDITNFVAWTSSNAVVAAFVSTNSPSTATALASGSSTIKATLGSVSGTTTLTVK